MLRSGESLVRLKARTPPHEILCLSLMAVTSSIPELVHLNDRTAQYVHHHSKTAAATTSTTCTGKRTVGIQPRSIIHTSIGMTAGGSSRPRCSDKYPRTGKR